MRGLDARARAEIEAAGELREVNEGDLVYRAGDAADAFCVLAQGACELRAVRRGEQAASVIRRVMPGEVFGEEATLRAAASRAMEAAVTSSAKVAIVKATVFRRAAGRVGEGEVTLRLERTLRRAATADLLRTMAFTRDLPSRDLETLLDAALHRTLAAGEVLFHSGERPAHVFFVADGMLQLQTEDDGRLHVRAYVAKGDVIAEDLADLRCVAVGPAWVLSVARRTFEEISVRHAGLLARVQRVAEEQRELQADVLREQRTTQHVLKHLYRLDVARSLLVIDQDACVRCGHCATACAGVHTDGVARLVRRGDKVVTPTEARGAARSLLLPNSCQHCENPACMIDCPTGAIGRDPRGEVFIRAELCIGCGNCVKACPWDNVEMAPRTKPPASALSDTVAVKCDLCTTLAGGPACVRACPHDAIHRVVPKDALPEVALLRGTKVGPANVLPAPRPAWPWFLGAVGLAVALWRAEAVFRTGRVATGTLAGSLLFLLVLYPVAKRAFLRGPARAPTAPVATRVRSRTRLHFVLHLAIGALAAGVVLAHMGVAAPRNVAGSLAIAFWAATLAGGLALAAYRLLPRPLTRLQRKGALPEDLPRRKTELEGQIFRALSGRDEVVKLFYARVLRPYARNPVGPLLLVASGRSLREEEEKLKGRLRKALAGRGGDRLAGLDALVRIVVDLRAVTAETWLSRAIRMVLPVHVVLAAVALALLVIHVFFAVQVYR